MQTKRLVVANWKMNPESLVEARNLFQKNKKKITSLRRTRVVVAPPAIFISSFRPTKNIYLGAQNVSWAERGAFTGEIGISQLANFKVSHIILGHSERRALGETDEMISKKIKSVLGYSITPILCIGELERDNHGEYLKFIENQLRRSLAGIGKQNISRVVIAYEPVWAIGKSADEAMNSHKLHEMTIFIRKTLSSLCGRDLAHKIQIIYGGSVEIKNTSELMKNGNVSGLLVGRASLDAQSFSEIVKSVDHA